MNSKISIPVGAAGGAAFAHKFASETDQEHYWQIVVGGAVAGALAGTLWAAALPKLSPGMFSGLGMKMHPLHPNHPYNNGHKVLMHGMGEQEGASSFLVTLGAIGALAFLLLPKG